MKSILKYYYKQLYANKMNNLEEMDKFLEINNSPRLNPKEIENIKRLIISIKTESVIKKTPSKQMSRTRLLHRYILLNIERRVNTYASQTFPKNWRGRNAYPKSFYEASIVLISKPDKDTMKKENYMQISLKNTNLKILNNILAHQIQQDIKKIIYQDQARFISWMPGWFSINLGDLLH